MKLSQLKEEKIPPGFTVVGVAAYGDTDPEQLEWFGGSEEEVRKKIIDFLSTDQGDRHNVTSNLGLEEDASDDEILTYLQDEGETFSQLMDTLQDTEFEIIHVKHIK